MAVKPIQAVFVKNVGNRYHPQFREMKVIWDFLLASYRGGMGMHGRTGMTEAMARSIKPSGYYSGLFRFKREGVSDYINRVAMTPYRPYGRSIIETYANYVTKEEPERANAEQFDSLIDDIDRKGTKLTKITNQILCLQQAFGEINILVDWPKVEGVYPSKAAENQAGVQPYAVIIEPQRIVDWSINDRGKYDWVLYEAPSIDSRPEYDSAVTVKRRVYWDANVWQVYREQQEGDKGAWFLESAGEHPCGETPIIRVSARDVDNTPITPESWAYDLFDLNRAIYNLESVDLVNLYYQTFAQLIRPTCDTNNLLTASVSEAMTEDCQSGEAGCTRYIQPSGAESVAIGNKISSLKNEMYNIAGQQQRTDSKDAESAEAKKWDFEKVNQFMAELSKTADYSEQEILRLCGLWTGSKTDVSVNYPKDYSVEDIEKSISAILDLKTVGYGSDTLRKELLKKAARAMLPEVTNDTMILINKEIDESEQEEPYQPTRYDNTNQPTGGA